MTFSKKARQRRRVIGQLEAGKPIDYELPHSEKQAEEDLLAMHAKHGVKINPVQIETYSPRDKSRIPKEGAWVQIIRRLPALEGDIDKHIRVGRIFFAEHVDGADEKGFRPDGSYKIRVESKWGTVCLWPYEYTRVDPMEVIKMWQDGAMIFHPVNMETERFNQVAFYLRARGISMANAVVMTLGSILSPIGWFEPEESIAATLEGMEERINRWEPSKHSRRKTHKRMEIHITAPAVGITRNDLKL